MNRKIENLLNDKGDNYILPFFWQHGEEEAVLIEEIEKIAECGIGAFCVEARPHPNFGGEGWWHDLDIIMNEARKRSMKVWLLDDSHFPTGFCNGLIAAKYPNRSKKYLDIFSADICGPKPVCTLNVEKSCVRPANPFSSSMNMFSQHANIDLPEDDELITVVARPILRDNLLGEAVELTDKVINGMLCWDVPVGNWRVFSIISTRKGLGNPTYMNMVDRESVSTLIEAVYEPHFERYKEDFGKTFAGFFCDEPPIGNTTGFAFDESIGKKMMPLPWGDELAECMENRMGKDWRLNLPALWYKLADTDEQAQIRYDYMDLMTELVSKNYSNQIGKWCEEHNAEFIGHIIEDNNQHSRLGQSLGHYFRSLSGLHMAGIDDIGNQVMFGQQDSIRTNFTHGDGEFFHYALGKLGSSHAHIDPKKKGRTMCEIFGAYGWELGVRHMKWLTDHFLVRGVNVFVPHAFSPKEFPDGDCPPHFYARGNNPQFPHFKLLMKYMNRMCNLFNDGVHCAPAAILYHGESEWTGDLMFMQKPARKLTENQIDFDFIPSDIWRNPDEFKTLFNGKTLNVNKAAYRCLIIPEADYIPYDAAKFIIGAQETGFPVFFINRLPKGVCGEQNKSYVNRFVDCNQFANWKTVSLEELPEVLRKINCFDIEVSIPFEKLCYMRYIGENETYFFTNESAGDTFTGKITLPCKGIPIAYDAMRNTLSQVDYSAQGENTVIDLTIAPYESIVIVMENELPKAIPEKITVGKNVQKISGPWKVSFATAKEYPNFSNEEVLEKAVNISLLHPNFSGTIRYETEFLFDGDSSDNSIVCLDEAFEAAQIWLNDKNIGTCICPPYKFFANSRLLKGKNKLVIEVTNTLVHQMGNEFNHFSGGVTFVEPSGLIGDIAIHY